MNACERWIYKEGVEALKRETLIAINTIGKTSETIALYHLARKILSRPFADYDKDQPRNKNGEIVTIRDFQYPKI